MNNNLTELVFILDKSGSMHGMEKDTIGGFNSMIEKQKAVEGNVFISTILFSNFSEVIHDRKSLEDIPPLTKQDYQTGGCTALLDAIGDAIKHVSNIHKYARDEDVPDHTLFVITTDGMENASTKYTSNQIKEMIKKQEKSGWEFLFLAANIDAVETADSIGIRQDRAVNYCVEEDTGAMYKELSDAVCMCRTYGSLPKRYSAKMEANIKNKKRHEKKTINT